MSIFRALKKGALVTICILQAIPTFAQSGTDWSLPLERCWSHAISSSTGMSPGSDNVRSLFLPKTSGQMDAYDAVSGDLLWKSEFGGYFSSELVLDGDSLLFVSGSPASNSENHLEKNSGRLIRIDLRTGISKVITAGLEASPFEVIVDKGHIFMFAESGAVRSLTHDGSELWNIQPKNGPLGGPVLGDGFIGFGTADGRYVIVSQKDGSVLQMLHLSARAAGSPLYIDDRIYIGDSMGTVHAVDVKTGQVAWRSRTGGSIVEISAYGENLLVSSFDNFVYLLAGNNGRRLWKRKLSGRIIGNTMLNRDNAAYVSHGAAEVYVLRLRDGRIVNRIDLEPGSQFAGRPIEIAGRLILVTNQGLFGYGPAGMCK